MTLLIRILNHRTRPCNRVNTNESFAYQPVFTEVVLKDRSKTTEIRPFRDGNRYEPRFPRSKPIGYAASRMAAIPSSADSKFSEYRHMRIRIAGLPSERRTGGESSRRPFGLESRSIECHQLVRFRPLTGRSSPPSDPPSPVLVVSPSSPASVLPLSPVSVVSTVSPLISAS